MKIKLTLFLSALLLFTGCVEVTFPEPMPMNRRSLTCFPTGWVGVWSNDTEENAAESITIGTSQISVGGDNITLGEEAVVRRFAGYLVLSVSGEDNDGRWLIYLAKKTQGALHVYTFDGDDDEKIAIWEMVLGGESIGKITKDLNDSEVKEYKLNPENNFAFRELINKGGLSSMGKYVK